MSRNINTPIYTLHLFRSLTIASLCSRRQSALFQIFITLLPKMHTSPFYWAPNACKSKHNYTSKFRKLWFCTAHPQCMVSVERNDHMTHIYCTFSGILSTLQWKTVNRKNYDQCQMWRHLSATSRGCQVSVTKEWIGSVRLWIIFVAQYLLYLLQFEAVAIQEKGPYYTL